MADRKNLSDTLRIDLIPGTGTPKPNAMPKKPTSPHLAVKWPKRASEPTAVARSRYQELLQSVYDAAIVSNVYGRISDSNGRAEEFLGYERDELCSLQVFDVIAGSGRQLLETLCEALQNERFTLIQAYCKRRDGSFFPAEIAVNMLHFGQLYLCFFIRDITRRKQTEDRLRTEHEAVQNAAAGIVIANLDARIEYANPAFLSLLVAPADDELIGKDLRSFCLPDGVVDRILAGVLGAGGGWQGDVELRGVGGETTFVSASATCGRDEDGGAVSLVITFGAGTGRDTGVAEYAEGDLASHLVRLQGRNEQLEEQLEAANARLLQLSDELEQIRPQSS